MLMERPDFWSDLALDCDGIAADYREAESEVVAQIHADLQEVFQSILKPRPRMRVDQASDRYRWIPQEASANFGKFKVSTYEVARGPMMAVTEPGVRIITVAAATQLMKTTLLESTALYFMIIDPAPVIMVEPNEKSAADLSKTKIGGMIANTPRCRKVLLEDLVERKAYLGGFLKITNAGSETNLAQNAIRVTCCDEIDKYELLKGGDPVKLTEERSSTFGDRALNIRVCSPRFKDGPIWKSYLSGDQRLPFIVCPNPDCGHDHVMRWTVDKGTPAERRSVKWDSDEGTGRWDLDSARYHCPKCDHAFGEAERLRALSKVKWRQTRPFTCCPDDLDKGGGYQKPEETREWVDLIDQSDGQHVVSYAICKCCKKRAVPNRHASFNASRLYSPKPLSDLVAKFQDLHGSPSDLQVFVNSHLAEPWEAEKSVDLTADGLAARVEVFPQEVPHRVAVLTVGVDTHDDRLEYEVVGWGRMLESWSIEFGVITGKPSDPATWRKLDEVIFRDFEGADGRKFVVQATCVDSGGHQTNHVYRYALARTQRRVWAIRGKAEAGRNVAPVWPKSPTVQGSFQVPLYELGTTAAKTDVMTFLSVNQPGPRFMHVPYGRDHGWFAGLLSEKLVPQPGGVSRWRPKYEKIRNEALDCRVYAYAALNGLIGAFADPLLVERLADKLGIGRDLTDGERERFGAAEIDRIAEETNAAIVQGRAKPVRKTMDGGARAVPGVVVQSVAQVSDESLQSPEPGRRAAPLRSLPAARRAPFVVRRPGTPRGG